MVQADTFYTAQEVRARLGISTMVFDDDTPLDRDAFRVIADAGIATVEIIDRREVFQEEDPASMADVVANCRDFGLTVTSFHSRSVRFNERGVGPEVERSKRMIDHLLALRGKVWGTHAKTQDPETRAGYEALARHYEGADVSLVVENFNAQPIREVIEWIDGLGHPQVGMILDVGHEITPEGQDVFTFPGKPTEILHAIGPRLRHVHLHDFRDGVDHYPPFEGELQWVELFRALKAINYRGAILFEPASQGDAPDTIRKVGRVPERLAAMARGV